jgi:hypothetical protein
MSTTRSVRPTDLVALVSLDGRVYPNEARTWESLGRRPTGPRILDSALVPWISFATGRHTWISVQGQSIQGLISARQRGNRTAWEVDCLIAATEDDRVIGNLFEQLTSGAGSGGVLRIFLRLGSGSDLTVAARRAGFVPYAEERLMRAGGSLPAASLPADVSIETYKPADAFSLFRLYNAVVPDPVRRLEAPTFQQWQAAVERRSAGRKKQHLIVRRNGEVIAELQSCRGGDIGKIDMLVHPSAGSDIPAFVNLAASRLDSQRPTFCLVPSYAESLGRVLEEAGFSVDSEYIVLMKRLAVTQPALKPARSHAPAQVIAAV